MATVLIGLITHRANGVQLYSLPFDIHPGRQAQTYFWIVLQLKVANSTS
jgi:hypothetical protein